jgi:hypothetical protein
MGQGFPDKSPVDHWFPGTPTTCGWYWSVPENSPDRVFAVGANEDGTLKEHLVLTCGEIQYLALF